MTEVGGVFRTECDRVVLTLESLEDRLLLDAGGLPVSPLGAPAGAGWLRCPEALAQVSVGVDEVFSTSTGTSLGETATVTGAIRPGAARTFESELVDGSDTLARLGIVEMQVQEDSWEFHVSP
jgi:hypothetical protein